MGFWILFAVSLLLTVSFTAVGVILKPTPTYDKPQPSSLGDFDRITADPKRAIPVIFGTVRLDGANLVWYNDVNIEPITQTTDGGLFGSDTTTTTGYKYYMGFMLALCHGPIDWFYTFFVDEETPKAYWNYSNTSWPNTIGINIPPTGAYDIYGALKIYQGSATQGVDSYLNGVMTQSPYGIPAYRGLCYVCTSGQMYIGKSGTPPNFAFVVARWPNQLGVSDNKHKIESKRDAVIVAGGVNISTQTVYDANPACVAYEILTDAKWGLGVPSSNIDVAGFQAAAATLHSEGLGLSLVVDNVMEAAGLLQEVLRYCDGVLYTDPTTGKFKLKLARADYDAAALPVFDETNVSELQFSRMAWSETKNTVRVQYIDCTTVSGNTLSMKQNELQRQNMANIQVRNGETSIETLPYNGCTNSNTAEKLANRALKVLSYPLAKVSLTCNRTAYGLVPGSVFKLDWEQLGLTGAVFRVTGIGYGQLDNGRIEVEAVEDIFGLDPDVYAPPPTEGWQDPYQAPLPVVAQKLLEAPYHFVGSDKRYVMTLAQRASTTDMGYEVWSDPSGGTNYSKTNTVTAFTPTAQLRAAYGGNTAYTDATGFTVDNGQDLSRLQSATDAEWWQGKNLLVIDNEIMAWQAVTDNGNGTYTISGILRGAFDTLPADHADNARVFFFSSGYGATSTSYYGSDVTLNAKLLPYNTTGVLPLDSASNIGLTTVSRAKQPYPVGRPLVAGSESLTTTVGDVTVSWPNRNKATQLAENKVYAQDEASTSTIEGTLTVDVYVGGTLKRTFSGLTSASQVYTAAQRAADDSDGAKSVYFRIKPTYNGINGPSRDTNAVVMTGLGMTLGQNLGGKQA